MSITKEQANKVYNILVDMGGALDRFDERLGGHYDRNDFIYNVTKEKYPATEWRFQGHFGFGGKYYPSQNRIGYYPENRTDELDELLNEINNKLSEVVE